MQCLVNIADEWKVLIYCFIGNTIFHNMDTHTHTYTLGADCQLGMHIVNASINLSFILTKKCLVILQDTTLANQIQITTGIVAIY